MNNKKKITILKKQINYKFEEANKLQEEMLLPKKMIAASLIKRYLGTKKHKRTSPAFYLAMSKNGVNKLEYISKSKVKIIKTQTMEWKKYKYDLKRWRELMDSIRQDFKQLGELQDQLRQKPE